ncbi:MAG: autotransporter-associated beta strand repeat-containing protein, partial [Simkaniaceae bacterium]|nr:autotransporter-associated beta strand repeat-containing protein [Simkaniaceae bacterium]
MKKLTIFVNLSIFLYSSCAFAQVTTYVVTTTADPAVDSSGNISGGGTSLRSAILKANLSGAPNGIIGAPSTITFDSTVFSTPKTIKLNQALPMIFSSVSIQGPTNGVILDGQSVDDKSGYRGLFIGGLPVSASDTSQTPQPLENVVFSNLTLCNMRAKGGDGCGGGMGAGGALFINQNAKITLKNVNFANADGSSGNKAVGGNANTSRGGGGLGGNGQEIENAAGGGGMEGIGGIGAGGGGMGGYGGGGVLNSGGGGFGGSGLGQILKGQFSLPAGKGSTGMAGGSNGGGGGSSSVGDSGDATGDGGSGGSTTANGGGGGVDGFTATNTNGGTGGIGGGGGGAGTESGFHAGAGGFGGGGGGSDSAAGAGGFGGGGGGSNIHGSGGAGGFGGGGGFGNPGILSNKGGYGGGGGNNNGSLFAGGRGANAGGGGAAMGGSIFVAMGGGLTIQGSGTMKGSSLTKGNGFNFGSPGETFGKGIFLSSSINDLNININGTLTFIPDIGETITYNDAIADQAGVIGLPHQGFWNLTLGTLGGTAGTLVLGGNNLYAGATTINAGILSISSDINLGRRSENAQLPAASLIFNGGTLETTQSVKSSRSVILNEMGGTFQIDGVKNITMFSGGVNGNGSLTKTGEGILVLRGSKSYSGGTIFKEGILSINSNTNLGASSSPLTFNGGTLETTQTLTSSRSVTLNELGGTFKIDGLTNVTTFSNGFNGDGPLSKTGEGTLVIGGNTYNGDVDVKEGTLTLN